MECLRIALLVIFLICVVPCQSGGSFLEIFRNLAEVGHNPKTTTDQMSPSSSPVQSPLNLPKGENCDEMVHKCEIKDYNLTACVPSAGIGSQASYVLVVNDGESSFQLNMTINPANMSLKNIEISGHRVKKVNLPSNAVGPSSILVNVKDGECVIPIGVSIPQDFYTNYLTHINGTYLLLVAAVFIGGTWTCCKLVKTRHLEGGVPYQELEMEHQESNPAFIVDSPEGWDQKWDDDWDEENALSSPNANRIGNVLENGTPLK